MGLLTTMTAGAGTAISALFSFLGNVTSTIATFVSKAWDAKNTDSEKTNKQAQDVAKVFGDSSKLVDRVVNPTTSSNPSSKNTNNKTSTGSEIDEYREDISE